MSNTNDEERTITQVEADFNISWEQAYAENRIDLRDVFYLKQLAGIRLALKDIFDVLDSGLRR